MKLTEKIIEKAISGLDWKTIVPLHITSRSILITKEEMIKDLKESIYFLIEGNIREMRTKYWMIRFFNSKDKDQRVIINLEVFYLANGIICCMTENQSIINDKKFELDNELKVLKDMMDSAVKREEFELCDIIKKRINAIVDKRS